MKRLKIVGKQMQIEAFENMVFVIFIIYYNVRPYEKPLKFLGILNY